MNHQRLISCLLVLAIFIAGSSTDAQMPRLYTTQSRHITLPYSVDNTGGTSNVTLLLSMNHGKTWKQHSQQSPDQKQFRFKAHRDGEFWFCTRTNLQKHVVPLDLQPELRVYVDTQNPQIKLRTERNDNSEVVLHCQVFDPTITADKVITEIQTSPGADWIPFPLKSPPNFVRHGVLQLEGRWQPRVDTRVVRVRVRAEDAATNMSQEERQVFLPPLKLRRSENYKPIQNPYTGPVPHEGAVRWPADSGPDLQTSENVHSIATTDLQEVSEATERAQAVRLPDNVKVHQLNSPKFKLQYNLVSSAAAVAEVQLWATEDGGQNWVQWGIDADKQSPLEVEIQREGTYGFKTVVTTADATTNTPPLPGAAADIWIHVDTTQPELSRGEITYSDDAGIPEALIRWTAQDNNFGSRPIRLHYQSGSETVWHEISLAVPNTGIYRWNLDPDSSVKWRVKIEAIDRAGNISSTIVSPK